MKNEKPHFLLDVDEVLADFVSSALNVLNKAYGKSYTIVQFAAEWASWDIPSYYGINTDQFWAPINSDPHFWLDLKPIPWAKELHDRLSSIGDVTIVTTPSIVPSCAMHKLEWLNTYLDIKSDSVFLGARKYLMAGNGILIDDSPGNITKFREAGGIAIQVPAKWNTVDLTFDKVWETIETKIL